MRTLTTRNGRTVQTTLTDYSAIEICASLKSNFARDLYKKSMSGLLSSEQVTWCHIMAMEYLTPRMEPKAPALALDFASITSLFKTAAAHLKYPKIRLQTTDGRAVVLSMAGSRSKAPGTITVTDDRKYPTNTYYGRIETSGTFSAARAADDQVKDLLTRFSADPAGTAAAYGRLTGNCCFCQRTLTDERSTTVGYGPVCADHYGLPWGETHTHAEERQEGDEMPHEAAPALSLLFV